MLTFTKLDRLFADLLDIIQELKEADSPARGLATLSISKSHHTVHQSNATKDHSRQMKPARSGHKSKTNSTPC